VYEMEYTLIASICMFPNVNHLLAVLLTIAFSLDFYIYCSCQCR